MRIVIAGLLGGIVMFVWGAVAHTALPIGEMGLKIPAQQDSALASLAQSVDGEGVYMFPSIAPEKMNDTAAMEAFAADSKGKAFAFVIYQPTGNPAFQSMGPNLGKQFASDLASAIVAAWVLSLAAFGFGRRVMIAGAMGLFSWLSISVPYWNWYLFPLDFTLGNLVEQVIGWLVAGAAIAWWLGRGEKRV